MSAHSAAICKIQRIDYFNTRKCIVAVTNNEDQPSFAIRHNRRPCKDRYAAGSGDRHGEQHPGDSLAAPDVQLRVRFEDHRASRRTPETVARSPVQHATVVDLLFLPHRQRNDLYTQ